TGRALGARRRPEGAGGARVSPAADDGMADARRPDGSDFDRGRVRVVARGGAAARSPLFCLLALAVAACGPVAKAPPPAPPGPTPALVDFEATAYSIEGETAAGTPTRDGVVAADPDLLPIGTRIRLHDA